MKKLLSNIQQYMFEKKYTENEIKLELFGKINK